MCGVCGCVVFLVGSSGGLLCLCVVYILFVRVMAAAAMAVSRVAGTVYIQRSTVRMRCSRSAIVLVWLSVIVSSLSSMDSRRSPSIASVTAWALSSCSGIIDVPVVVFFFAYTITG